MCLICNAFDGVPTKFQLLISVPVCVLRVNFAVKCALTFPLWETIGISYFSYFPVLLSSTLEYAILLWPLLTQTYVRDESLYEFCGLS